MLETWESSEICEINAVWLSRKMLKIQNIEKFLCVHSKSDYHGVVVSF